LTPNVLYHPGQFQSRDGIGTYGTDDPMMLMEQGANLSLLDDALTLNHKEEGGLADALFSFTR